MSSSYLIEIATSDFITTRQAVAGGADRIELCANLAEGGTTPSYGQALQCRNSFPEISIFPIIRPRGGDFLYTQQELDIMLADIKLMKQLGCDGVVIGALEKNGKIHKAYTAAMIEAAYPLEVTFHRAFDRCRDPFEALEQLIALGCTRILTSGQQPVVEQGMALMATLNKAAGGRIVIMPGSGVRKENIYQLAQVTGCYEFHSSLRGKTASEMEFISEGFKNSAESYINNAIDPQEVINLRNALVNL